MNDNKLYSINELILWLEHPSQQWSGNRPLMYAKYARAQLAAYEAAITAAREVDRYYFDVDDEFTPAYWVDEDYNKVLSSDSSRKWMLTNKTIAQRKLAAALAALEGTK